MAFPPFSKYLVIQDELQPRTVLILSQFSRGEGAEQRTREPWVVEGGQEGCTGR